ncbi:MAG: 50S ribosomal protein L11 methyltransferase [Roseiflexus sp.]|nr:50S ribosomal protein L11 methyltransferase [Roseiflexus sp.]MCS7289274.1 50S ribosomal protein L11 methyltransferase [Roseiflexus sp.]MDW8148127.1 50S ribosomal protein L11 methyltransferase [Roseiflexaceae bacterium]MDW8232476.1 50S ribosomal protein L11 methyltransferase [Roseiflexaceae bacterium]
MESDRQTESVTWLELSVSCDSEAVEPVSELLARYGYNGGVAIEPPIIPGEDGPEYQYDPARPVTVRTYLALDDSAEETRARIEQGLWLLGMIRPVGPLQVRQIEEEDWANAWKRYYSIQRIGARIVIVPSWLDYQPLPNDLVVRLDPGMAFGTGLHPTTQLCLIELERHVAPGMHVLDLGCGSGILSIAAARLGAARVLALDTDPIAVAATRANVALNDMTDRIIVAEGSLGRGASLGHWLHPKTDSHAALPPLLPVSLPNETLLPFDLIVANIIARVLVEVAPDFVVALRPGGILISSGIVADREPDVVAAYAAVGLEAVSRRQDGDWVALVHRKL